MEGEQWRERGGDAFVAERRRDRMWEPQQCAVSVEEVVEVELEEVGAAQTI